MEEHRFHEGKLPSAYRYNFEQSLFNTEVYRLLQASSNWISFYILNERELLVEGEVHFHQKDGVAKSSIQSPFGGIEISTSVSNKTLFHFIEFVCATLTELNCKNVIIVDRPMLNSPETQALVETFLLNLGFAISNAEVGSVINVTNTPFHELIHPRKKRKLSQTQNAGFEFKTLAKDSVSDVYSFIESHRKKKNYTLSISLEHLLHTVEKLPDAYELFGVFHNSTLVAASVTVQVSKNILYHFISDHVRKIEEVRPSLLLMQGIYQYCQKNNIQLLDLGTSATDGLPNFKLIKFKTELGGKPTQKLTFTKTLS